MSNPATTADIAARWRPLSSAEATVAETRLDDAWRKLKRDVPTLESRMATNTDLADDVVRVLADAVIRLLRNLERNGLRRGTVSVDDGATTWEAPDSDRATLYFTDAELSDLAEAGKRRGPRAFSVMPS